MICVPPSRVCIHQLSIYVNCHQLSSSSISQQCSSFHWLQAADTSRRARAESVRTHSTHFASIVFISFLFCFFSLFFSLSLHSHAVSSSLLVVCALYPLKASLCSTLPSCSIIQPFIVFPRGGFGHLALQPS